MRINELVFDCTNAYKGVAVELYVSGCTRHCKNCHNPELQSYDVGEEVNYEKLISELSSHREWFDIVSILGGDLLCQNDKQADLLVWTIRTLLEDKQLMLFTGAELEEIPLWAFEYFDIIKYGSYKEELKQEGFPSSSNQRIIYKGIDYE